MGKRNLQENLSSGALPSEGNPGRGGIQEKQMEGVWIMNIQGDINRNSKRFTNHLIFTGIPAWIPSQVHCDLVGGYLVLGFWENTNYPRNVQMPLCQRILLV